MHAKVIIIGSGPGRIHRCDLRGARHAETRDDRGPAARWPADHHHRCRKLSGFADVIQGPWLMEQMKAQADPCRHRDRQRSIVTTVDFDRRPFALTADSGDVYTADSRDHRHRRPGQMAGHRPASRSSRASASPPAPPATASSIATRKCWWSAAATTAVEEALYPHQFRRQGHGRPSPQRIPRRTHPAGTPVQAIPRSKCAGTPRSPRSSAPAMPPIVRPVTLREHPRHRHGHRAADRRRLRRHRPRAGDRDLCQASST